MSAKQALAWSSLFEHLVIILVLFGIPLLASFFIWIAGNSFGVSPYPPVSYGIGCVTVANATQGICNLWTPAPGGTAPQMIEGFVKLINGGLVFVSLILGLIALIKLGPGIYNAAFGSRE